MPWGGKRVGAGRKPKPKPPASDGARVLAHPSAPALPPPPTTNGAPEVEEFDAPDSLTMEERAVWLKQAPHAFRAGTLTRGTALAFERYCRIVVLEQNEAKSSGMGGSNHRGLLRQINAYELQFMLIPCGKPLAQPAAPQAQDQDDAFFDSRPA
jgi:hypothetical protein